MTSTSGKRSQNTDSGPTGKKAHWQPECLENELVRLVPLQPGDFERLYQIASDPLIWEQHPQRERYKRDVFQKFFDGAISSGSAFSIEEQAGRRIIGSTRFYDYDEAGRSVAIGYTFLARAYWGGKYNQAVKKLLLDYAFRWVDQVFFHVGPGNTRSATAMERIGARKMGTIEIDYYGEKVPHLLFAIRKGEWEMGRLGDGEL